MSGRHAITSLTPHQLSDGYGKAISNALRLLQAAMSLTTEFPEVALGLAEIGQEEIGKSLSLLAAFSLASNASAWRSFWSAWNNHELKAHRAFLYELISPLRIEIHEPRGLRKDGLATRERIKYEKEVSFYVNFEPKSGLFLSPEQAVDRLEVFNRVFTLLYLAVAAWSVKRALDEDDATFRYRAFSEIALRICSEDLYQQDMPALFTDFERRSTKHEALLRSLRARLAEGKEYLTKLIPSRPPSPSAGSCVDGA
jgi:AbiV family abortive infection protein